MIGENGVFIKIDGIVVQVPELKTWFCDVDFNSFNKKMIFFGEYAYSPLMIRAVNFIAELDHPETKILQQKYHIERGKIS